MGKLAQYEEKINPKSKVWTYFLTETNGDTVKCKFPKCLSILKASGGSTIGMWTHLERIHKIKKDTASKRPKSEESEIMPTKKQKITDYMINKKDETLKEVFAKMSAKDGITFNVLANSEEIRKGLVARGFQNIPTHPATVRKMVVDYSISIRHLYIEEISHLKSKLCKFSACFDEYTSIKNPLKASSVTPRFCRTHRNSNRKNAALNGLKSSKRGLSSQPF